MSARFSLIHLEYFLFSCEWKLNSCWFPTAPSNNNVDDNLRCFTEVKKYRLWGSYLARGFSSNMNNVTRRLSASCIKYPGIFSFFDIVMDSWIECDYRRTLKSNPELQMITLQIITLAWKLREEILEKHCRDSPWLRISLRDSSDQLLWIFD